MLRSLILAALFVASAGAAIWPEHLGKYERKSIKPIAVTDQVQTEEYGLEQAEEADYGQFQVSAARYKDSTGAYAASLANSGHAHRAGNYVITCSGNCPKDLASLVAGLPKMSHGSPPADYLPAKGLIPGSQRYILGPIGLQTAVPQIPASAVAFQFSPEGEIGRYQTPGGEVIVGVFSYPTMEMARQQAAVMEKLPDAVVKRSGPLVTLAMAPHNQAAADRLLAQINYQAVVSSDDQQIPLVLKPESAAQMILAIIALAGIVLGFCLLSGLAFGALRVVSRKFGYSDAGTPYTTLHLSDK